MKFLFIGIIILFPGFSTIVSQSNASYQQKENSITEGFLFIAEYAKPKHKHWISLIPDYYSVTIRNDSVFVYLPYYGKIRLNTLFNQQGNLYLQEAIKDYSVKYNNKKSKQKISFKADTEHEELYFFMKISKDGNGKFTVNSEKRDSIVYKGRLK